MRVLLLGGTAEARGLAAAVRDWPSLQLVTSLAGRVRAPQVPAGQVRIGGFGGVDAMTGWLREARIDAVLDATHPFAARITEHAAGATAALGLPFAVLRRPGWRPEPADDWRWADSMDAAARLVPSLGGGRVFLTVGRDGLAAFTGLARLWFLVRTIEPVTGLPGHCEAVTARGPFTVDGELELMRRHRIDVLVSKDSGGGLTAAKLVAARRLGLPVLLVRRPALPMTAGVPVLASEQEALAWLRARLAG